MAIGRAPQNNAHPANPTLSWQETARTLIGFPTDCSRMRHRKTENKAKKQRIIEIA
jgi:hypothetical protein